jgi:spore germination protein Q
LNGTYYQNPTFPTAEGSMPEMNNYTSNIVPVNGPDNLPMEQSYIENILRLNRGKNAKAYISFPDSVNWKDKIFDGTIEQAGRDHLVMSVSDGRWFLIPMIYLDYVEFDEKIIYKPSELKNN